MWVIGKSVNVSLMWLPTVLLSIQAMEKDILCSSTKLAEFFSGRVVLPVEMNGQASYYAATHLSC